MHFNQSDLSCYVAERIATVLPQRRGASGRLAMVIVTTIACIAVVVFGVWLTLGTGSPGEWLGRNDGKAAIKAPKSDSTRRPAAR
jgi:hypothetical protein